jgi:hypothetical protein
MGDNEAAVDENIDVIDEIREVTRVGGVVKVLAALSSFVASTPLIISIFLVTVLPSQFGDISSSGTGTTEGKGEPGVRLAWSRTPSPDSSPPSILIIIKKQNGRRRQRIYRNDLLILKQRKVSLRTTASPSFPAVLLRPFLE